MPSLPVDATMPGKLPQPPGDGGPDRSETNPKTRFIAYAVLVY